MAQNIFKELVFSQSDFERVQAEADSIHDQRFCCAYNRLFDVVTYDSDDCRCCIVTTYDATDAHNHTHSEELTNAKVIERVAFTSLSSESDEYCNVLANEYMIDLLKEHLNKNQF